MQPKGGSVHFLFGQREQTGSDVFERVKPDLLKTDNLPFHANFAVRGAFRSIELRQLADLGVDDRIGKVIRIHLAYESLAAAEIEFLDLVLAGVVKINRFFMQRREGGWEIHFADNAVIAGDIHDQEVIACDRSQTDGIRRITIVDPVPGIAGVMKHLQILGKEAAESGEILFAELLAVADRKLEGGTLQVAEKDLQIIGVDMRLFGRGAEEIIRVLDDVLIERRAGCDQHRDRGGTAPAGTSGALPSGSDIARVAGENDAVERPDIDAELKGVGGDHGPDVAAPEPLLNMAALLRKIAATIAADGFVREGQLRAGVLQIRGKDFGRRYRFGKPQEAEEGSLPGRAGHLLFWTR